MKPCAITLATSSGSNTFMSCVSSIAKTMPVNGDRMVPPRIAPMLTSGQKPAPSFGRNMASTPAERAAHHQQRSQHASRCSRAQRHRPDDGFHDQNPEDQCCAATSPCNSAPMVS